MSALFHQLTDTTLTASGLGTSRSWLLLTPFTVCRQGKTSPRGCFQPPQTRPAPAGLLDGSIGGTSPPRSGRHEDRTIHDAIGTKAVGAFQTVRSAMVFGDFGKEICSSAGAREAAGPSQELRSDLV